MEVVSFFSYKGGVGRTLAVSQVAEQLSRFRLSSLVIDFDLEAPGMLYKFEKDLDKIKDKQGIKKGVVDYIHAFFVEKQKQKLPNKLKDYYYSLPIDNERKAPIWLMPAGDLQGNYWDKLADIDWKRDFLQNGERLGSHLLLDLKERIRKELNPDYVLIDSRTGISDITTLTLRLMADKIVVIAVNNSENLDGSEIILRTMIDHRNQWNHQTKQLFFALSRLPMPALDKADQKKKEEEIKQSIQHRFVPALIEADNFTVLHNDSELAWGEKNIRFTPVNEHVTLKEEYGNLFKMITRDNQKVTEEDRISLNQKEKANSLYQQAVSFYNGGQYERAFSIINEIALAQRNAEVYSLRAAINFGKKNYANAIEDFTKLLEFNPAETASIHLNIGIVQSLIANKQKDEEFYLKAFESYKQAISLKPDFAEGYYNWGYDLANLANLKTNDLVLYQQAFEKYQKATTLKPDFAEAYSAWGSDLADFAKANNDHSLYQEAFEKYQKAIALKPDFAEAYSDWGSDLADFAKASNDHSLYQGAFEKYQKAIALKPDFAEAYSAWGSDLADFAKANNDHSLYQEAFEKYQKAIALKPDFAEAYSDWGLHLADFAKASNNDPGLYEQAFEKYQKAIALKPDFAEAYYNWGVHLGNFAKASNNDPRLYEQAFEKYQKATALKPDFAEAYSGWGFQLANFAKANNNAPGLYQQAFEKYQRATALKPDFVEVYSAWGSDLADLAKANNDHSLFQEAFDKYQKATTLKPDFAEAYSDWGSDLANFAKASNNDPGLYEQAFEKYQKAIALKPDFAEAYYNWGVHLANFAKASNNDPGLYEQAIEKYQKAASLNPNDANIYNSWGIDLFDIYRIKRNNISNAEKAIEKLLEAEKLSEGSASFNLACAYSLINNPVKSLFYLDKALALKHNNIAEIECDSDLDSIRNLPAFKQLIEKYRSLLS